MIKNIVFDMGNVLMDYCPPKFVAPYVADEGDRALILEQLFRGPEWLELDEGVIEHEEALERVLSRLPQQLHAQCRQVFEHWADHFEPVAGMAQVVEALNRVGYRLYLLTNASVRFRSYQARVPGIDLFEGVLVSAEERLLKPDPAIFDRLCAKFGLRAEECLFIDDSAANVEGAQRAGMAGCWLQQQSARALWSALAERGLVEA